MGKEEAEIERIGVAEAMVASRTSLRTIGSIVDSFVTVVGSI
jgi:hypothetical protein